MKSEILSLTPEAIDSGILSGKKLTISEGKEIVYLSVNAEIVNDDMLQKEAKDFWIVYKYLNKDVPIEPTEKIIS